MSKRKNQNKKKRINFNIFNKKSTNDSSNKEENKHSPDKSIQDSVEKNDLVLHKTPQSKHIPHHHSSMNKLYHVSDSKIPNDSSPSHLPNNKQNENIPGKEVETYQLNIDKASVSISIRKTDIGFLYYLSIPRIDPGTAALLEEVRRQLISLSSVSASELIDEKSIARVKQKFMEEAQRILKDKVPEINQETVDLLSGILLQEMLGLGKIEFLISDPGLEEIVILSSKEPVRTYHKKYGWLKTNIIPQSEDEINNYSSTIARRVGRQINVLSPLLDAHVITGDRANAVLYPVSTKGNTITIRKFARDPWTIIDLVSNNTVSVDVAATIWLAVEYEMNVLISGGTASGKTSFLNACMPFIPPNQRIISMEDTRELTLPEFLYWAPLVTRAPNSEGKGEVKMLDLLVNSLRMRPDRIVLGEIRRNQEAEVLFEAMHTGHSVYATVHADTAAETIRRLMNPPINVPASMIEAVNLNVVMFRDRRKGLRRVFQLAEFVPAKDSVSANILFRWVPEKDIVEKHNTSMSFFDQLNRHTGMSISEINKNLEDKKRILNWMIKNKVRSLYSIGKVMNLYYTNYEMLSDIISKNKIDEVIEKENLTKENNK